MKAVVFHAHGPVENLHLEDLPEPEAGPGECLLKVKAVSLNGFDPMVLEGIPGLKTPFPMIPGADIAAEIVALGEGVDGAEWKVGDRVGIMPNQSNGMMGETLRGGMCENIAVIQEYLLHIPDGVSDEQAACLPTAYGAAIRMMYTRGKVAKGERVLILGASGGVGTCCVQLATLAGCEVVACTSSEEKAAKLKDLGAAHVINTSAEDFVSAVVERYGKPRTRGESGGVDVCVNYTGGETWSQCFRTVKRGGRILTCGATAGYDPKTDIRYIWSFEHNIVGSNGWTKEDHALLLQMIAEGRLVPSIHSVRPMAEARTSMRDLMDRKVLGKALLIP